jgi:predicted metal-binding membrane protein
MTGLVEPGRAERRDRRALLALLAGASVVCWAWTARMAAPPEGGHVHVHGADLFALFVMWAVMMIGMMISIEVPVLLHLARVWRQQLGRSPLPSSAAFLAGYLLPWIAFSLGAAAFQSRLQALGLMNHGMATSSRALSAALLLAAGAVQLSPLKRACLDRCRAPGLADAGGRASVAFAGGLRYSALAMASCGLLMLILFVTGVMNLAWMVLLTLLLLAEKVAPPGWPLPAAIGALLIGWGGWTLVG